MTFNERWHIHASPHASIYPDPPSVELLNRWLDDRHITTHPSLAVVQMADESGLTVNLKSDSEPLAIGTSLCIIPKSTIFSHRTASLASVIPPPSEVYDSPAISTLYLTACLLHELRLGTESEWYGWLQILPREMISLPTFWADETLCGVEGQEAHKWIRGTSAEAELRRKNEEGLSLDDLRSFFDEISPLLPSTASPPATLADFAYTYSLVSSRGFVIDAYHIIALVPFCDLFNHSSFRAATSLLSDTAVCAMCGKFGGCEHEPSADRGSGLSDTDNDEVEMRAERPIAPGEEVFSCYEDNAGNGKLLVEWGFVEDTPSTDGISWNPLEVLNRETIRPYTELLSCETLLAKPRETSKPIAPSSDTRPGMLNVYADGRASINLVIALALPHILGEGKGTLEELEEAVKAVEIGLDSGKVSSPATKAVLQNLKTMIQDRFGDLRKTEASLLDLQNELSALSPAQYSTRMALTLYIQERAILERASSLWS